jgi:hypothetical protein
MEIKKVKKPESKKRLTRWTFENCTTKIRHKQYTLRCNPAKPKTAHYSGRCFFYVLEGSPES